jgi:hypothetical protein
VSATEVIATSGPNMEGGRWSNGPASELSFSTHPEAASRQVPRYAWHMPSFADTVRSPATRDELWDLLSDATRLPEWWDGGTNGFRLPQLVEPACDGERVVISCLVSDQRFELRLEDEDNGTRIDVLVDVPDTEAARLDEQRETVRRSLLRLAEVGAVARL